MYHPAIYILYLAPCLSHVLKTRILFCLNLACLLSSVRRYTTSKLLFCSEDNSYIHVYKYKNHYK